PSERTATAALLFAHCRTQLGSVGMFAVAGMQVPPQRRPAAARRARSGAEPERRVGVSHEDQRVADYAVVPADDALNEAEDPARVAAREQDREPCADGGEKNGDVEEEQHHVV